MTSDKGGNISLGQFWTSFHGHGSTTILFVPAYLCLDMEVASSDGESCFRLRTQTSFFLVNGSNMIRDQRLEITTSIVNGILVIVSPSSAQSIPILPVHISSNSWSRERCCLPRDQSRWFVRLHAVLLEDAWFADFYADAAMFFDPRIAEC